MPLEITKYKITVVKVRINFNLVSSKRVDTCGVDGCVNVVAVLVLCKADFFNNGLRNIKYSADFTRESSQKIL